MGKSNMSNIIKKTRNSISKHSPGILTGLGIAGMITSTILAVKATPKAMRLLEEKKEVLECEKLSKKEVFKTTWKCYVPSVLTAGASVGCLIGANSVNVRRNAALATAYSISETAFREYRSKVLDTVGAKKEKLIRDKVAEERINNDPVGRKEIFITDKGNTLCYDTISGRYFRSDIDKIKKAENELNKQMLDEMYISLNEFYEALGLGRTKQGDLLGWNIDGGLIELDFSSQIAEDGTPCLVIDYWVAPKYDYNKFM